MKKLILLFVTFLLFVFLLPSCNDDDGAEKFSTLSVEENKAIVEDSGIDFVDVMSRMEALETVGVLVNLGEITSNSGTKGMLFSENSKLFSTLGTLVAATSGEKDLNSVFDAMISSKELKSEDPESIQQFWDENVGTYTWNPSLNDWDIVLGGNKIIFLFPSAEGNLSNDATLTIYNYAGVNIANPVDEDYTGDLPVSLNADLKVGTTTLVTFVFGASYNDDGVPNAVAADLTIETFKFEVDISNTTEVVSVNYKFLESGNVIMDMGATGNGLFTEENIDDNTTHYSETNTYVCDYIWVNNQWVEVYCEWTDEWDETEFEEILNSAEAHFQLFNIVLKGDINVKGLVDQIRIIDEAYENEQIDEEEADTRYASKINEFLNLRLINLSTNEIMAKAEAYVVHETDYYGEWTYIDFRLTFGDGSPIDMETYFDEGFDTFVSELNDLIYDINSDYDTDIEPIDY